MKKTSLFSGLFESKKKLKEQMKSREAEHKLRERRLYEAANLYKEGVLSEAPNQRSHWQARPLRDQARHLYENDPVARRVVDSIVCNMIGSGVTPLVRSSVNRELASKVDRWVSDWAGSTECDYDGDSNLVGIQSLAVKSLVRDGAVFIRRIVKNRKLKLQVLEADYLDVTYNGENEKNKNQIINGIEFSKKGQAVAYWLYEFHPEDVQFNGLGSQVQIENPRAVSVGVGGRGGQTLRVPATEVCHVRRVDRAGQNDGFSWLAPALIKIWDLREYEDAKLKQQKIQACFTAFVEDNFALSEEEREDFIGDDPSSGAEGMREINAGYVENLPPGKTITFPSPTGTTDERFVERCLRQIAAALGVSYEIFNDYSNVNFSSGRMGFLEMDRHLKHALNTIVIPQALEKIADWVLVHLEMNDVIPSFHDIKIRWSPQAREMIDPGAETNAILTMLGGNLISLREAHSMLGYDFEKNIAEILDSNTYLKEVGLTPLEVAPGGVIAAPEPEIDEEEVKDVIDKIKKEPKSALSKARKKKT